MKIRGNTVGTPMKRPDFNQTNPKKSDYILNNPIPQVTEKDEGKILQVKDGKWSAVEDTGAKAEGDYVPRLASTTDNLVYVERSKDRGVIGYKLSPQAIAYGIPERTPTGAILVPETPATDNEAVPKKYVDDIVGDVEATLDSIISMQESLIGGDT